MRRWNATAGPVVTKVLIGINLAVFLLTYLSANIETDLVLYKPFLDDGEWWRLITTGFVHFGFLHIAFNMLMLYRFGEMLEPALGRVRFGALYFAALLGGALGALVLSPNAFTGGASGAVFGLMGAVAVGSQRMGLRDTGVGGLIVVNLLISVAVPGISLGGHIGGLIAGAVVGSALLRTVR